MKNICVCWRSGRMATWSKLNKVLLWRTVLLHSFSYLWILSTLNCIRIFISCRQHWCIHWLTGNIWQGSGAQLWPQREVPTDNCPQRALCPLPPHQGMPHLWPESTTDKGRLRWRHEEKFNQPPRLHTVMSACLKTHRKLYDEPLSEMSTLMTKTLYTHWKNKIKQKKKKPHEPEF